MSRDVNHKITRAFNNLLLKHLSLYRRMCEFCVFGGLIIGVLSKIFSVAWMGKLAGVLFFGGFIMAIAGDRFMKK